jgi:deazaflavin-dependent oxidoreductase (nitroreductase family)
VELILAVAGVILVGIAALAIVFVLGMRAKWPIVLRPVIRISRAWLNPQQLKTAGQPGAFASVIRHVGRRSGRGYETPVGAVPTNEGFVIALPYGLHADWVRNVLASGSATIVHDGRTVAVEQPEIVPTREVADHFPAGDRRSFRLLRTDQCLRVRRVGADEAA